MIAKLLRKLSAIFSPSIFDSPLYSIGGQASSRRAYDAFHAACERMAVKHGKATSYGADAVIVKAKANAALRRQDKSTLPLLNTRGSLVTRAKAL